MTAFRFLLRSVLPTLTVATLLAVGCTATGGGEGTGNDNGGQNANDNSGGGMVGNGNDNDNDNDDDILKVALVATSQNDNLAIFDDAVALDGFNLLSSALLEPGNASNVFRPQDSAISSTGVLFVCSDTNSTIAIYDRFLTASGTRAPDREVSGDLSMISRPLSVAIDPINDVLYVLNREDPNILVFNNVSDATFDGDVAPVRTITRDAGPFLPSQIFFSGGSLYVVDEGTIVVFEDDGTLDGPVPADRVISSPMFTSSTRLNVSVDSLDRLVLTARGEEVFIYNDASMIDGSPAPDLTITVDEASTLNAAVIDSFDTLYAMDFSDRAIYVIDDVSLRADGLHEPDRSIQGPGFEGSDRLFLFERFED